MEGVGHFGLLGFSGLRRLQRHALRQGGEALQVDVGVTSAGLDGQQALDSVVEY
jgi:hypothetical protein